MSLIAFYFCLDADPVLLAQQLSARPSIVSVASEEGTYSIQTQPLPSDFSFVPALKVSDDINSQTDKTFLETNQHTYISFLQSPLPSSRASSITGPPTSRRSSHHMVLEPVKVNSY